MQRAVARNVQLLDLEDIKRVSLACKGLHACLAEISDPEALGAWLGRRLGAQGFSIDGIGISEMEAELEGLRERPGFSKSEDATLRAPRSAVAAAALLAWPRAAGLGPAQLTAALLAALRAAGAPAEVVAAARAASAALPPALPPHEQMAPWARAVLADGRPPRLTAGAEPTAPERAAAAAFAEAARRALGPRALLLAPFAAAGGRAGLADAIAADALGRCCALRSALFSDDPHNILGFGDLFMELYNSDCINQLRLASATAAARAGRADACLRFLDAGPEADRATDRRMCCKVASAGGRLAAMEDLGAYQDPTFRQSVFHVLAKNGQAEVLRGFIARCMQLPRGAPAEAAEAAAAGGNGGAPGGAGAGALSLQQPPHQEAARPPVPAPAPAAAAPAEATAAQPVQLPPRQESSQQEEEAVAPQPGNGGGGQDSAGGSSDDEDEGEDGSCRAAAESGDGSGADGDSDDGDARILTARCLADVCAQPRGADVLHVLHELDGWREGRWRCCCPRCLGCGAPAAPAGAFRSAAMELPYSSSADPEEASDIAASLVAALAPPACLAAHLQRAGGAVPHALLGAASEAQAMLRAAPELAPALAPLLQAALRSAAEGLPAVGGGGDEGGGGAEHWREALQAAALIAVGLRCAGSAAAVLEAARRAGELGCLAVQVTENDAGAASGEGGGDGAARVTASLSEWLHALQPAPAEGAAGGAAARGGAKRVTRAAAAAEAASARMAELRGALVRPSNSAGGAAASGAAAGGGAAAAGQLEYQERRLVALLRAGRTDLATQAAAGMDPARVAVAARRALGAWPKDEDEEEEDVIPMFYGTKQDEECMLHAARTLALLRAAAAAAAGSLHNAPTVESAALVACALPAAGSPWLALAAQAPLERVGGPAALEYPIDYDDYGTDDWDTEDEWEAEHGGCC
ncbi:MAG: hypothetical protein J3K34DRAFT_518996 [Monoraphidium minutum]|nr:MAG: hypothetical protein J3K34DRAFT_518996 [Monoraphidium minutum]